MVLSLPIHLLGAGVGGAGIDENEAVGVFDDLRAVRISMDDDDRCSIRRRRRLTLFGWVGHELDV